MVMIDSDGQHISKDLPLSDFIAHNSLETPLFVTLTGICSYFFSN